MGATATRDTERKRFKFISSATERENYGCRKTLYKANTQEETASQHQLFQLIVKLLIVKLFVVKLFIVKLFIVKLFIFQLFIVEL